MAPIEVNERTAVAQAVGPQPDGPGLRIGKKGEVSFVLDLAPGGAKVFHDRLPQIQAEANYWESAVGTVSEIRAFLFDDDKRMLLTITFDGDFLPYLDDIRIHASPWLDQIFTGVLLGFDGVHAADAAEYFSSRGITAELFWIAHPDVSVRDLTKMKQISAGFNEMLDATN